MRKEIILCDVCQAECSPTRGSLIVYQSNFSAIRQIQINEMCQECANKIADFVLKIKEGGSNEQTGK